MQFEIQPINILWTTLNVLFVIIALVWWLRNRKPPKPPACPTAEASHGIPLLRHMRYKDW